jgi:hypothetical protein
MVKKFCDRIGEDIYIFIDILILKEEYNIAKQ